MYCKCIGFNSSCHIIFVLIVAKCIVNDIAREVDKVLREVLIVAKCIVNYSNHSFISTFPNVLIVAKCIVN